MTERLMVPEGKAAPRSKTPPRCPPKPVDCCHQFLRRPVLPCLPLSKRNCLQSLKIPMLRQVPGHLQPAWGCTKTGRGLAPHDSKNYQQAAVARMAGYFNAYCWRTRRRNISTTAPSSNANRCTIMANKSTARTTSWCSIGPPGGPLRPGTARAASGGTTSGRDPSPGRAGGGDRTYSKLDR